MSTDRSDIFETYRLAEDKRYHLHSIVTSCGHAVATESYVFDGQTRPDQNIVVFQWTLSGRGELNYEGEVYSLEPGTAFCLPVPHNHSYCLPEGATHWEYIFVCFSGREFRRIYESVREIFTPVFRMDERLELQNIVHDILHTSRSGGTSKLLKLSAQSYSFILQGLQYRYYPEKEIPHPGILRLEAFCRDHFRRCLTVSEIAREAGMSRSHMARTYKKVRGITVGGYIERLRMEEAARLLSPGEGKISVQECSLRCGYDDANYFCRVFRKFYGMPPMSYKRLRGSHTQQSPETASAAPPAADVPAET